MLDACPRTRDDWDPRLTLPVWFRYHMGHCEPHATLEDGMADNAEMLFAPELVFFDWECATPDEVFARLEGELAPRGYIASGWLDAVRTREDIYP